MIRICIVIQSDAFRASAGMRIRYDRIMAAADPGAALFSIKTVDELCREETFDADCYVFSKTFSADALIMCAHLKRIGKRVGQDIFDDYFSQSSDSRLSRFRAWLRQAAQFTDFAVCTTERMAGVLRPYLPGRPVEIVDDPVAEFDQAVVSNLAHSKIEAAARERRLSVVWFGIGDNPFFPVGLRDLAARGDALGCLRKRGWDVDLVVLTNERAASWDGLRRLRSLPIPFRFQTWSEEDETAVLAASTVAFIPVNAQSFSRAKSSNRCLTALKQGCQVIAPGFPIYDEFSDFIYEDPGPLAADLERGSARLSPASAPALAAILRRGASAKEAALTFAAAASSLGRQGAPAPVAPICVVHGLESKMPIHKLAQRLGGLSVRSPFHGDGANFDVRFDIVSDALRIFVAERRTTLLSDDVAARTSKAGRIRDLDFVEVPADALGLGAPLPGFVFGTGGLTGRVAAYPTVMRFVVDACRRLVPGAGVLVSEGHEVALAADSGSSVRWPEVRPA